MDKGTESLLSYATHRIVELEYMLLEDVQETVWFKKKISFTDWLTKLNKCENMWFTNS